MSPTVSICIPSYKQPDLLRRNIDSVLAQSYKDYEIIITDDSPDDSVEKALRSSYHDFPFRYYRNLIPKGSPENWNYAIKMAKGKYIKMIHHDDWFTTSFALEKYVMALENNPKANFAFSACQDWFNDKRTIHYVNQNQLYRLTQNPKMLLYSNIIGAPSTGIYRNGGTVNYDVSTKWVVDVLFYIDVITKNNNIIYIPEVLMNINAGSEFQVTHSCNNKTVDLYESIYGFNKYSLIKNEKKKIRFILLFLNKVIKFHIKSLKDLEAMSIEEDIAKEFKAIIIWGKIFSLPILNFIFKVFNKVYYNNFGIFR